MSIANIADKEQEELEVDVVDEVIEDQEVELEDEEAVEEDASSPDDEESQEELDEDTDDNEDFGFEISVDGETLAQDDDKLNEAPEWVKNTRKENREKSKKIRELEAKLESINNQGQAKEEPVLKEPGLWDDGIDGDDDKYRDALRKYYKQEEEAIKVKQKAEEAERAQQAEWDKVVEKYDSSKKKLKLSDYEDAEEIVRDDLDNTQRSIIMKRAKNPAAVVYALAKKSDKRAELSSLKDPFDFNDAIRDFEKGLKISKRKSVPSPEKKVKGKSGAGSVDSTLKRLEEEASKTGNMNKLLAYERKLKEKRKLKKQKN